MLYPEFSILKRFINNKAPGNCFYPVTLREILDAERRIGYLLPNQLRVFYQEVGYGFLKDAVQFSKHTRHLINRIISPCDIAELVCGESEYELSVPLKKNHMPFFDLGSGDYFVMKPSSKFPDRVYWFDEKTVVASDFVEFIQKLLDNPFFYLTMDYPENTETVY